MALRSIVLLVLLSALPACVSAGELRGLSTSLHQLAASGDLEDVWADRFAAAAEESGALAAKVEQLEASTAAAVQTAKDVGSGKVGLLEGLLGLGVSLAGIWIARDQKYPYVMPGAGAPAAPVVGTGPAAGATG